MSIEVGGMSAEWRRVLDAALRLPEHEREMLVDKLHASLENIGRDGEWARAWSDELDRRDAELDDGAGQPLTLEVVRQLMCEAQNGEA